MILKSKRILITGGTGSFGRAFVRHLLEGGAGVERLTVFSRDEQKHYEMGIEFPENSYPIRYVVGDVRDMERVNEAMHDTDIVVHAAAMKHVPVAEMNPIECVKTNILGAHNVAMAALSNNVERVVALSTDKAAMPTTIYGASKLGLEKVLQNADLGNRTKFSVVRYANVFGSSGSVVPFFLKRKAAGKFLPITDPEMTRFSITMKDGIELVLFALEHGWGGEIIAPIAPSYRIVDVANAIAPKLEHRTVGSRPGEKRHELLYTETEAPNTVKRGRFYIVCPANGRWNMKSYCEATGASPVDSVAECNSGTNSDWLSVDDIRRLVED